MHKYYIDKIIKSDDKEKMEKLRKLYEDTVTYLKDTDYNKYKEIECAIYEISEGKRLSEEKAKKWVEGMKPAAKWSMEDTNSVRQKYNVDIPEVDFYVLMNMMYSDYHAVVGEADLDKYVGLSKAWYNDEDTTKVGSEKLYCYWKNIVE